MITGTYFQRPLSTQIGAVRTRKWRAANPERQRQAVLRQLARRPSRETTRAYRAANKKAGLCIHHGQRPAFGTKCCLYCWDQRLQKNFGIDIGEYVRMLVSQHMLCKICGKSKPLRVDHCHTSGKVRGLICNRCNVFVGYLETSENGILNSINEYLGRERKLGDVA